MIGMNIVGATRIPAASGLEMDVLDPSTGERVGRVPSSGPRETRLAIDAAAEAFRSWRRVPAQDRAARLHDFAGALDADRERLASIISLEQGKPRAEAGVEIDYATSFLRVSAEEAGGFEEDHLSIEGKDVRIMHQPVGVTAAITPWNFPIAMLAKKTAPALAAGCVQVVKPAEQTPLSAIAYAEVALASGIPAGVVNVVTGPPEPIGRSLLDDARVRKLSFTGSTEVGRILMRGASANLTRLSMELGGHAPFVVFEDADLELAVRVTMAAKFRNAGQTCIAPNRFIIHDHVHDEFVDRLRLEISGLVSGRGDRDGVDLGPLIDDHAMAKVSDHILDAVSKGASIACGGGRRTIPGLLDRFPDPTILLDTGPGMACWEEETFGPVCPLCRFSEEGEAVKLANQTPYGLAAYAITADRSRIDRLAADLEVGIVGINDGSPVVAEVPFGGVGHSGFGREGGRWALQEYLETRTISTAR